MDLDSDELTALEKEEIKKEIEACLETLIHGCETLDMDMAFSLFEESPEFLMMGTDGLLTDYHNYLKNNIDYLQTCSVFHLNTVHEEIRVLDRRTVVLAWAYRAEATLKTGDRDIVEKAGASFVFRKSGDGWRVVYYHESSVPPVRI